MSTKTLLIVCVTVAVVAAGVSGVIVTGNRADVARALAEKAEADLDAEKAVARQKESESRALEAKRATAEAEREARRLAAEQAEADAKTKAEEAKLAAAGAETAKAKAASAASQAKAAAENRAAEKEKTAQAEAAAAQAAEIAKAAEAKLAEAAAKAAVEKTKAEAIVAEAKALELRKIDFETIERQLIEFKLDLDERERALRPDKTSADLTWVGEREVDVIGGETNRVVRKARVCTEDDLSLPAPTRRLARAERLKGLDVDDCGSVSSNSIVKAIGRLYEQAREDGRIVDAEYYLKSIRMLYPNWKPEARR